MQVLEEIGDGLNFVLGHVCLVPSFCEGDDSVSFI